MRILTLSAALSVAMALAAPAAPSDTNTALRSNERIYNGLFAIAVADQVRKNCDEIAPRLLRAYSFLHSLRAHANALGFSDEEITNFIEDRAEKDLMRAHVMRYFDANGVVENKPETYCALGHAEIAAGSQAGALLRAR
ncbi:DUF5333 domain-containing protein [Alkalilacustris brevis]|uniref:DUF5333 domain-containing protein n=1 Tax=Alkalilacustris brevis TaxID=2026338 RepID=UPI000E0D4FBA|nr:DUF5333 domain-containing protein [Alkalilacustris brevis]